MSSIIANPFQWAITRSPRSNGGPSCRRSFSILLLLSPDHNRSLAVSSPIRYTRVLPSAVRFPPLLRRRFPRLVGSMSSLNSSDGGGNADQISGDVKTVRAVIKGRVQGVFYRNWTIDNAKELSLKGWVRNRRDGSVEALFSGPTDKVQEMEQRCRRGPPDAIVTGLQVYPSSDDPGHDFERKPTV